MYFKQTEADLLSRGLEAFGIQSMDATIEMFSLFIQELLLWNQKTNLIGTQDVRQIIIRHILDSLSAYPLLKARKESILDVGAGAGFPSLPLAIVDTGLKLTAIEKRRKRAGFLRNVALLLRLENLCVIEKDVRHIRGSYATVLARGVGDLSSLYFMTKRILGEESMIIAFKGRISEIEKEMIRLRKTVGNDENMRFRVEKVKIPYLEEEERNIVIIETG